MDRHRWIVAPVALVAIGIGVSVAGLPSRTVDEPLSVGAADAIGAPTGSTSSTSFGALDVTSPTSALRPSPLSSTVPAVPPYPGEPLVLGDAGQPVNTWQTQMQERGWPVEPDGKFGAGTARIARSFQRQKGLRVTGEVDLETWNAAFTAPLPDDTTLDDS